tara:strand:- start:561 stop:734 length:174 start_codon:yes stop_codon:yes gene_type:complete
LSAQIDGACEVEDFELADALQTRMLAAKDELARAETADARAETADADTSTLEERLDL